MEVNPRRYPLSIIGSLLWLTFAILIYYYAHKPLSDTFVENFGGAVLNIFSVFAITLVAAGIGRHLLLLAPRFLTDIGTAERLSIEALLGFGILAFFALVVGLLLLHVISMAGLLIICAMLTFRSIRTWLQDGYQWIQNWHFEGYWSRGLALFTGVNLTLAIIVALAPPTAFDSLTYHLVGPKLWLAEGRFVSLPNNHFFAFPALVHTLFTLQMALVFGNLTGAALLQLVIAVFGIIAFSGYATRQFTPNVGLSSAAFFFAATSFWVTLSWPYVDMSVMAFSVIAVIALLEWRHTQQVSWLFMAGLFVGFTMSSKYNAVAFALVCGLFVLNYSWSNGINAVIRNGAILTIVAMIVLAPWLIRTWAFYDNPVYPFGPTTGEWDTLSNEFYFPDNSEFLRERWWVLAFLPLTATVLGIGGTALFDATIGPFYILLVPFLLLTWQTFNIEQRRWMRAILFIVGLSSLFWILFSIRSAFALQVRLVIYLFPWLTILAAVSFERLKQLPEKPINLAFVIRTSVALILIVTLVDHFAGTRQREGAATIEGTTTYSHFVEKRAFDYLLGVLDETAYLEHNLGWYVRAFQRVNDLEDDANVLFLWETRSLYCDEPRISCEEDTILMRWWHDRRAMGDGTAEHIIQSWRDRDINYVLVWETGRRFEFERNNLFTNSDISEWESVNSILPVIWRGEDIYTLYSLQELDTIFGG